MIGREMADVVFDAEEAKERYLTHDQSVDMAISLFAEAIDAAQDLKLVLVRNRTSSRLVTSDDPAVLTNRLCLQKMVGRFTGGGLGSSGIVIYLPLSPAHGALMYDGDIYTAPHDHGWIDARRAEDVLALNEQQHLNCASNIFFSAWADADIVRERARLAQGGRSEARYQVLVAVRDDTDGTEGWERYNVVPLAEAKKAERALFHIKSTPPAHSRWPSLLKWRTGAHGYSNGSGVGVIRNWTLRNRMNGDPSFKKVRFG
jgi:hypothetical protein